MEIKLKENYETAWISGECVFIHGLGVKFVENYDIL